jgi:anti-sigma factor RsiW
MTSGGHIDWADLVDYLAGDLDGPREEAVEMHLMSCSACAAEAARVAAVADGIRAYLPPLGTEELLESMRRRGLRVEENPMAPGSDKEARVGAHLDVLAHRLLGLNPRAVRASIALRVVETGDVLMSLDDVLVDQDSGSVILLCSPHYANMPPNLIASVITRDESGAETLSEYTIRHLYEK